jgi:hypothetical protein
MCVVSLHSFFNIYELDVSLYIQKICAKRPCFNDGTREFLTCGMTCAQKLANGGGPPNMCEVSLRRRRLIFFR